MDKLNGLLCFLQRVDKAGILYGLSHEGDSIVARLTAPEKLDVSFTGDGEILVKRYDTAGNAVDADAGCLDWLLAQSMA